jgi:hypothetical protein
MVHSPKDVLPMNRWRENKNALFILACVLAAAISISLCIPLISKKDNRQSSTVYHPRLYPLYYQTNTDAPIELLSSLGFPGYYKKCSIRTNRPLIIGTAAGIRWAAIGLASILAPGSLRVAWGDYPALSVVFTYCVWIFINILLIGLAMAACFRAFAPLIGKNESVLTAVLLCTAPIVILSIREIGEGSVQVLLIAASLLFWQKVLTEKNSLRRLTFMSLAIGILLLGKLAITTFAVGCVICLFTSRRKLLGLIIPIVCLPMAIWICVCAILGIPFTLAEVSMNAPAIKGMASIFFAKRLLAFPAQWAFVLAESGLFLQMPLALVGLWWLAKNKHPMLKFILVFVTVDFCFYCGLGRTHAVYGLHTMILYFPLVAVGITQVARWISEKMNKRKWELSISLLIALVMQGALIALVVPTYGG